MSLHCVQIAVACDLATLLRRAINRKDEDGVPMPIKIVVSTHHSLFFNVMCNEMRRAKENELKVAHKRYFLHRSNKHRPNKNVSYTLQPTEDTPFFHHVASLVELQKAADPDTGKLYTFHFNALRSIMEKTAAFFGHSNLSFCHKMRSTFAMIIEHFKNISLVFLHIQCRNQANV